MNKGISIFWATVFWGATAVWLGILWYLSSLPGGALPQVNITDIDKIVHFSYFFLGGVLMTNALRHSTNWPMRTIFVVVLMIVAAIGVQDEWHQTNTPGRSGNDQGDLLADCFGGGLAALLVTSWYGRKKS